MAPRRREESRPRRRDGADWSRCWSDLIGKAEKKGIKLAPFIGIGCPGIIDKDGSIERGAQNLPGNWECSQFHLPSEIHERHPQDRRRRDLDRACTTTPWCKGLSEVPFMQDVERWGVLTIGTGLGNARFTNRGNGGS